MSKEFNHSEVQTVYSYKDVFPTVSEYSALCDLLEKNLPTDDIFKKYENNALTLWRVITRLCHEKTTDLLEHENHFIKGFLDKVLQDLREDKPFDNLKLIQLCMIISNLGSEYKDDYGSLGTKVSEIDNLIDNKYKIIPPNINYQAMISADPLEELAKLPENEYWRLYVDGEKQKNPDEKGWDGYESREPGCIFRMHDAFKNALENLAAPPDMLLINSLHALAMNSNASIENSLRGWSTTTGVSSFSYEGFLDMYKFKPKMLYNSEKLVVAGEYYGFKRIFHNMDILGAMQEELKLYNQSIKKTNQLDAENPWQKKLFAIIKLCSNLAKLHPFLDGNCRTFSILLLNRELVRNGFKPCILNDPNKLEDYISYNDIAKEIQLGIKNYELLIKTGKIVDLPDVLKTDQLSLKNAPLNLDPLTKEKKKLSK